MEIWKLKKKLQDDFFASLVSLLLICPKIINIALHMYKSINTSLLLDSRIKHLYCIKDIKKTCSCLKLLFISTVAMNNLLF